MSEWILVSLKMPVADTHVLLYECTVDTVDVGFWSPEVNEWRTNHDLTKYGTITHWMPLPEPPTPSNYHNGITRKDAKVDLLEDYVARVNQECDFLKAQYKLDYEIRMEDLRLRRKAATTLLDLNRDPKIGLLFD